MNKEQWDVFARFRAEFKEYCFRLNEEFADELTLLQRKAAEADTPAYSIDTAVVYNGSLEEVTEQSEIKLILAGDNPGKNEQAAKNRKYLTGLSGKIAENFFKKHGEFDTDFRKNAIILNKTPIHTAKTKHLRFLRKNGSEAVKQLILETQLFMAEKTARLHQELCAAAATAEEECELWLVGYGEMKNNGIFSPYKSKLKEMYFQVARETDSKAAQPEMNRDCSKDEWRAALFAQNPERAWNKVFAFQHFSMNRFSIDLNAFKDELNSRRLAEENPTYNMNEEHGTNNSRLFDSGIGSQRKNGFLSGKRTESEEPAQSELSIVEVLKILGQKHKDEIFKT